MKIYICSSNRGKLREILLAADGTNFEIAPLPNLKNITPPEETGATFEENASLKALYYSRFTPEIVLADDSGLEVDALDGAPGVWSARYSGPDATDETNNSALLRNLGSTAERSARFVCVVALARTGEVLQTARGAVEGKILPALQGTNGFGYDPLFFYPPLNRSFAELTPDEKLVVSHRGKALRALFEKADTIRT
ncbi:MAG: RdgB/HAM1 family non-canonical purine NTP pyrophosphatase [Acidobacteriaceae bacterium]|nr:RdgB/HAM1 family non-canonical purine NTP pyrophosphatase [Acidobacteriaceae bacterium]MBV9224190.1 RdgB/HAM1 family non-canonical purine NTP pyrophosphatase [Acidobacteriaceae bacterium]MBV9305043.1 RdgB/HAM1 family non-canonical purine NTP pyrophosphatase [Acidobacteriaceae bacterium]